MIDVHLVSVEVNATRGSAAKWEGGERAVRRSFGRLARGAAAPALATLATPFTVNFGSVLAVMLFLSRPVRSQPPWSLPRPAGAPQRGGGGPVIHRRPNSAPPQPRVYLTKLAVPPVATMVSGVEAAVARVVTCKVTVEGLSGAAWSHWRSISGRR